MGAVISTSYVFPYPFEAGTIPQDSPLQTNTPLYETHKLYDKKSGKELINIEWLKRDTIPNWYLRPSPPKWWSDRYLGGSTAGGFPWSRLDYDPNIHRRNRTDVKIPAPIAYNIDEIYEPSFRDIFGYSTAIRSMEDAQILVETSLRNINTLKNQINAYNLKITTVINKWYVSDSTRQHIGGAKYDNQGKQISNPTHGGQPLNDTKFSNNVRIFRSTPIIINSDYYDNNLYITDKLVFIDPKNNFSSQKPMDGGTQSVYIPDNNQDNLMLKLLGNNEEFNAWPLGLIAQSGLWGRTISIDQNFKKEMGWANPKYLQRQSNFIINDFNEMDEELMPMVNELIASIASLIQQNKHIALGCRYVFQNINKGTPDQQKNTAEVLKRLSNFGLDAISITDEILKTTQNEKVNAFIPILDKYLIILQLIYEWEWYADGWMHRARLPEHSAAFDQWKKNTNGLEEFLPVEEMNKIEPLIRNELHAFTPVPPPPGTNNSNWVSNWISSNKDAISEASSSGGALAVQSGTKLAIKHGLTTTATILGGAVGSVLGAAIGAGIGIAAGYIVDLFGGLFSSSRKQYDRNWFKREIVQKYMELKVEKIASENKFNLIVGFYKQLNQELVNDQARVALMNKYISAADQKINNPTMIIPTDEVEGETPNLDQLKERLDRLLNQIETVSTKDDITRITNSITDLVNQINNIPDYSENLEKIESELAGIQNTLASVSTKEQLETVKFVINENIDALEKNITTAINELGESILGGQEEIKMGIGDVKEDVANIDARIQQLMSQLADLKNQETATGDMGMTTNPELLETLKENQRILLEQIKQLQQEKSEIEDDDDRRGRRRGRGRRRRRRDFDGPLPPFVSEPVIETETVFESEPVVDVETEQVFDTDPLGDIDMTLDTPSQFDLNKVLIFAIPSVAVMGLIYMIIRMNNKKK